MPNVEYFLVCRAVQKDVVTDDFSFISVLEDITPESFPSTIPRAVAVSLWNIEPNERHTDFQATLVVKVPNNPEVSFPMNFTEHGNRIRAIYGVLEIPIEQPGDIEFEVKLNGVHAATHTVIVHALNTREPTVAGENFHR